jgi:hypothetical protein
MYIYPVEEFITNSEGESSYLDLLKKTKGSWAKALYVNADQNKTEFELKASESRRKSW